MALPLPAFAAEMGQPRHRRKLWFGIASGYAIVAGFAVLAAIGHVSGVMPFTVGLGALLAFKLVSNTVAAIALTQDRLALELSGLNVLADILAMTGAIYATGGSQSPLVPIYGIELTVIALLTNVGVTVTVGAITFACFTTMVVLDATGVLPAPPPVIEVAGGLTHTYRFVHLGFVACVIALPTAFAASVLRRLRAHEAALVTSHAALVEAGRQKSQFMANVTHELRTPIHGICGLSDLIASGVYGPVTDRQRRAAGDIKGSALSLLRMIDDLLTLARDDAGRLEHRPVDVDLDEVLASVMATVGFLRGTRELEVRLEVEGPLPAVRADRPKLLQILINLVANAVKFTPDGGQVVLRARALDARHVELCVADDGIGIDERDHARIFEPFQQVDGSTERQYGGAGLGLALVRRLCAVMGADIRVVSALGRGSTFTVTLPVEPPPDMRASGEHRAPAQPGTDARRSGADAA